MIKNLKNRIIDFIKSKDYIKHIATLCAGTFLSQLIPMCFYPLLSRLYSPEDYGVLATFSQVASIIAIISSFKYETNILIEKNRKDAQNLFFFTILLSACVSLTLYILSLIAIKLSILPNSKIYNYIYVPFVMSFMIVIYQCYNEWCVRNRSFKNLSANKVINSSSIASSECILGLTRIFEGNGLFIGDMVGRIISGISCLISFYYKFRERDYKFNLKNLIDAGKRNIDCPKFVMPAQLLNVVGGALPVLLIGYFFDQEKVGLFSMANMVIIVPVSIMSLAIRDVFRQRAIIQYQNNSQCKILYIKNLRVLVVLSIIIFSSLAVIIRPLFEIVLGTQWTESATYALCLMPMIAISFISDALSSMMIVGKKLNYVFYWQILYFLLTLLPLIIGGLVNNIIMTLYLFAIGRTIAYIVNLLITYKISCGDI